jgi:hypothetical protein
VDVLGPKDRWMLAAAVATVAAAIALLATPGAASASKVEMPEERRGNFYGVVSQAPIVPELADKVRRGGVQTMRFIVPWSRIEAARDDYDWGFLDRRMGAVQRAEVVPVPLIFGFPSWMLDTYAPFTRPEFAAEFQEFLRDLVARYGPGGLASYYDDSYKPVRTWQIWNEPNLPDHLNMDQPLPSDYVAVLRLAAEAIHSVDPGASLIAAGLAPGRRSISANEFIRGVFEEYERLGMPPDFNEVAVHPYGSTVRVALQRVRGFRRAMNESRAGRRTPILIGELGWASALGRDEFLGGNPRSQARKLRRSFREFHNRRRNLGVSAMMWFALDDAPAGAGCSFCPYSGLFNRELEPKPAWKAFRKLVARRTSK